MIQKIKPFDTNSFYSHTSYYLTSIIYISLLPLLFCPNLCSIVYIKEFVVDCYLDNLLNVMFLVVRRVVESFTTSYQPESMNEESISTFVYSLVITSWNSFHMKQNSRKGKNIEITYEYCGYICKSTTIIVEKLCSTTAFTATTFSKANDK